MRLRRFCFGYAMSTLKCAWGRYMFDEDEP